MKTKQEPDTLLIEKRAHFIYLTGTFSERQNLMDHQLNGSGMVNRTLWEQAINVKVFYSAE